MATPYTRLPKGHIRLLHISRTPAESSYDIILKTAIHDLEDATQYTALSYCWGTVPDDWFVTLDDRPLRVRLNLWHFLGAITEKLDTSSKLFWIDAVSINQADIQERSEQVQLMPQIYSGAHSVLVWLGPAEQDSDRAMRCLQRVPALGIPKTLDRLWTTAAGAAFAILLRRPYWSRLWVVQELLLGQDLEMMCGRYSIPWHTMSAIYQYMTEDRSEHVSKSRMSYMRSLDSPGFTMARRLANKGQSSSLMSLIFQTSDLKCSQRLDKAFALLGLSTSKIKADYAVSVLALLNAILSEHYTAHPVGSFEQFTTVCKELCRCLTQSESTIFELLATRSVGTSLDLMPRRQCMCAYHYLKDGQALILAEPNACWIEGHGHYWMIEHLFALEDRAPDELMTLIFKSDCPIAIRWLIESVAFIIAEEASNYRQWISWASRVNLISFVRNLLEHRERSSTSYASRHLGDGDIDSLYEALAAPVDLVKHLITWLRGEIHEDNVFLYPSLRHAPPQNHTSVATQHEGSVVAAQVDSGLKALTRAESKNRIDQAGLLPRHDLIDRNLDAKFDAMPILCVTDKDHPELIKRLFTMGRTGATIMARQRRTLPSRSIRESLPREMAKLMKDTNIDQTTRSERSLLERSVKLGDVKTLQSVLKFKRCPTRIRDLASPAPVYMAYKLDQFKMLEELEKAYEAAIESIIIRSLKPDGPHASSDIKETRYLWPLILNKWRAHTRIRYRGDYSTTSSSKVCVDNAIGNVIGVAERLNMSVLELGSDRHGRTPLHYAVLGSDASNIRSIRAIISSGAQCINVPDEAGQTALFYALANGHKTIASMLMEHEATQIGDAITRVLWDLSPTPRPMLGGRFDPRQSLAQMGEKDWVVLRDASNATSTKFGACLSSDLHAIDDKDLAQRCAGVHLCWKGDDMESEGDDTDSE